LFVEGNYAEAVERLEELSQKLRSKEALAETYLYLGRGYMALGQYNRAIDAFTLGAAYGGPSPFREYLQRLSLIVESAPENITRADKITRGQLAVTIDRVIYDRSPGQNGDLPEYGRDQVGGCVSVQRGMMSKLPDGSFHAEDHVTRGQFYVVVSRLLNAEVKSTAADVFPGGFDWVTGGPSFVSGREVISILERVASLKAGSNGG
jgi:tetratricopeptide (TPR) repeat protein